MEDQSHHYSTADMMPEPVENRVAVRTNEFTRALFYRGAPPIFFNNHRWGVVDEPGYYAFTVTPWDLEANKPNGEKLLLVGMGKPIRDNINIYRFSETPNELDIQSYDEVIVNSFLRLLESKLAHDVVQTWKNRRRRLDLLRKN